MALFLIFNCISAKAADFDTLLFSEIKEHGIYNGSDGIIYAQTSVQNTFLAVVSVENNSFVCRVYGSENEITDTLNFVLGGKNSYKLEVTNTNNDFCLTLSTGSHQEYFRIINDCFTKTDTKPSGTVTLATHSNGKTNILCQPFDVYTELNNLKSRRVASYPLPRAEISDTVYNELLYLIKASADIMEYKSDNFNIDVLMRHVLYTHQNFTLLSSIQPTIKKSGDIMMCSSEFIDDVLYKAFRLNAEKPPVNMLTELNYCYNNGFYYYVGGYDTYFATDVKEITDVFKLPDNTLLIIFNNTYTEGSNPPIPEYSYATAEYDSNGYYITELSMGGNLPDFKTIHSEAQNDNGIFNEDLKQYLPLIISIIVLALVGIIFYFFIM